MCNWVAPGIVDFYSIRCAIIQQIYCFKCCIFVLCKTYTQVLRSGKAICLTNQVIDFSSVQQPIFLAAKA